MSSYRPLRFLDASARADEIVANYRLGIGTHSQSSEMHVVADAPEIRVQDDVSEVTETALRITADGGAVSFQSGVDFTNDSKGDIKFQSMLGATTHMTIDGSTGNVGIGTVNPSAQLTLGASSGSQIAVTGNTRLFSNTHYIIYGSGTTNTFEQVLLQFDTGGTGDTDQSEYAGYMDVEMVAQRTTANYLGPEIFTARLNFILGWNEAQDAWKFTTFVQENKGVSALVTDNFTVFKGVPVFKYKYVDRQLQIYVSFDANYFNGRTSFTARVTSDNPADVSTPRADALMASGTVGTAEVGICYGVGTNAANVGIGTASPSVPLHVSSSNFVSDAVGPASSSNNVFRVTSTEVDSTLLVGASDTGSYISSFSKASFANEKNLILNANGGNVGIGTNDPGGLLDVYGSSSYFFRMDPLAADDTSVSDLTPFGATSFKKQFQWHLNNRSWYWGIVNNNSAYLGLAYDGGTVTDPDPVTIFTTSGQLYTKDIICDSATMDYLILNDRNPADGGIEISDYPGNTYRLIGTHGDNGGLWQVSGRGGLALGSGDDCLILGAGDVWDQYTNGSISNNSASLDPEQETIYLCADTHLHLRLGIQNGWNAEYQFFDRENHYMDGRQSSSTAEHFTYYRNHGGSVYKVGYGNADSTSGLKLYSDNDVYMVESDENQYPFRFNVNSDIIYLNGSQIHSSDDRLKFNEARIVDATRTLMKLDPQTYDKKRFLHSNDMFYESGFIAQDVWYDAPELRHLVTLSDDAEPSNVRPYTPEDIQDDPDWEGAGWGKQASHLNYTGMIPHIVKSIQEIATESPREKTRVVDVTGADDISGLVVSATTDAYTSDDKPILALSNVYCDRACFGVVSDVKPVTRLDSETLVNTRGTGRVWVLNAAGTHLAPGDYVTTSNLLPGYAQIQADDITRSSTVAKITQVCDFTERLRPKRVIKQALSNVNYYVKTNRFDIAEEEYNTLDEENRESEEQTYYEYEATEIVEPGEPYDFIRYRPEITTEAYEALSDEEKTKYKIKYVKNVIKEELEEPPSTVTYETKTRTIYRRIVRQYFKTKARYRELEVRQELVNVLDEHGQLQWEDHPTETEEAYKIRYLDASGQQTDEANAVHIAAFVGCTYHCG
jgi:hypothetical protein